MTRFVDIYLPPNVQSYPCASSPVFSTTLVAVDSGDETANRNWKNPLQMFALSEAIRCHDAFEDLKEHWYVMGGPESLWPFRDPMDFASCRLTAANLVPAISGLDQPLGVGDGTQRVYQMVKNYVRGAKTFSRQIQLPVVASTIVLIDGLAPGAVPGPDGPYAATVEREGGTVTLDRNLAAGRVMTAGFLFDVPVRFENDNVLQLIVKAFQVSGMADFQLCEKRLC